MSLIANTAALLAEEHSAEAEELVPLPPVAYGVIAFVLLLVLLIVTTRLNLDR